MLGKICSNDAEAFLELTNLGIWVRCDVALALPDSFLVDLPHICKGSGLRFEGIPSLFPSNI